MLLGVLKREISFVTKLLLYLLLDVVDNPKGDDRDDINDSGMETFMDSPEQIDHETPTEVHVPRPEFDRTLGPRPGKDFSP